MSRRPSRQCVCGGWQKWSQCWTEMLHSSTEYTCLVSGDLPEATLDAREPGVAPLRLLCERAPLGRQLAGVGVVRLEALGCRVPNLKSDGAVASAVCFRPLDMQSSLSSSCSKVPLRPPSPSSCARVTLHAASHLTAYSRRVR